MDGFFEEFPEVLKLTWTQGTPGFNDGDPCVFSVHGVCALLKKDASAKAKAGETTDADDEDEDEAAEDDSWQFEYQAGEKKNGLTDEQRKLYRRISKALKAFDEAFEKMEDALKFAFGDGARVICTRKDIKTEEYDCN